MKMEASAEMRTVFADAWWGERDRRHEKGLPEDNEACDVAGLQAVLDRFWDLVPPHLPPEPDGRSRPKFIDRYDRVWTKDSGDVEYPWIMASGTRARWLMVVNAGPLRRVSGRRAQGARQPPFDPPSGS